MRAGLAAASIAAALAMSGASTAASPSAQGLRTCVDRWNQADMRGWGPALVDVSIRRLDRSRLAEIGLTDPTRLRCVVLVGFEYRADSDGRCESGAPVPGRRGLCSDRAGTFFCVLDVFGAYDCPPRQDIDRSLPLRHPNGTMDGHGRMQLGAPLRHTHATPPLGWQRYRHPDGWIEPWTSAGRLKPGLRFDLTERGTCVPDFGSEFTTSKTAIRCLWRGAYQVDPCYPRDRRPLRRGEVVACGERPGATTFARFVLTKAR